MALHPKTDCPVDARRSGTVNWSNARPWLTVYANAAGEDGHIERAQKRQDATDPAIHEFVHSIYTTHRATRLRRLAEKRKAEAEAVRLSLVALAAQDPEAPLPTTRPARRVVPTVPTSQRSARQSFRASAIGPLGPVAQSRCGSQWETAASPSHAVAGTRRSPENPTAQAPQSLSSHKGPLSNPVHSALRRPIRFRPPDPNLDARFLLLGRPHRQIVSRGQQRTRAHHISLGFGCLSPGASGRTRCTRCPWHD